MKKERLLPSETMWGPRWARGRGTGETEGHAGGRAKKPGLGMHGSVLFQLGGPENVRLFGISFMHCAQIGQMCSSVVAAVPFFSIGGGVHLLLNHALIKHGSVLHKWERIGAASTSGN